MSDVWLDKKDIVRDREPVLPTDQEDYGPFTKAKMVVIDPSAVTIERDGDGWQATSAAGTTWVPIKYSDPEIWQAEADEYTKKAAAALALAEHFRQNPAEDEAQITALAEAIRAAGEAAPSDVETLARRLVRAGVRALPDSKVES